MRHSINVCTDVCERIGDFVTLAKIRPFHSSPPPQTYINAPRIRNFSAFPGSSCRAFPALRVYCQGSLVPIYNFPFLLAGKPVQINASEIVPRLSLFLRPHLTTVRSFRRIRALPSSSARDNSRINSPTRARHLPDLLPP